MIEVDAGWKRQLLQGADRSGKTGNTVFHLNIQYSEKTQITILKTLV